MSSLKSPALVTFLNDSKGSTITNYLGIPLCPTVEPTTEKSDLMKTLTSQIATTRSCVEKISRVIGFSPFFKGPYSRQDLESFEESATAVHKTMLALFKKGPEAFLRIDISKEVVSFEQHLAFVASVCEYPSSKEFSYFRQNILAAIEQTDSEDGTFTLTPLLDNQGVVPNQPHKLKMTYSQPNSNQISHVFIPVETKDSWTKLAPGNLQLRVHNTIEKRYGLYNGDLEVAKILVPKFNLSQSTRGVVDAILINPSKKDEMSGTVADPVSMWYSNKANDYLTAYIALRDYIKSSQTDEDSFTAV